MSNLVIWSTAVFEGAQMRIRFGGEIGSRLNSGTVTALSVFSDFGNMFDSSYFCF